MAGLVCKGDIVTYCLTDKDAEIINLRRRVYAHSEAPQGVQVYSGAPVQKGNAFPMIITRKNKDDRANGQVFLDGTDTYWVVDVARGDKQGQYLGEDD